MKALTLASTLLLVAASAAAQPYPVAGEIYLSFNPNNHRGTMDVLPGETFDLWVLVDIPNVPGPSDFGIVGVEGAVALPPQTEFVQIEFIPSAINLGHNVREPQLETFIVGLGQCLSSGPAHAVGRLTLRLLEDGTDIEIGVTAPTVQAAALSSFAGIGPGWARKDCDGGSPAELVLFGEPPEPHRSVLVNPSVVSARPTAMGAMKARYE